MSALQEFLNAVKEKSGTNIVYIRGPLGIWTFPILNAIIIILALLRLSGASYMEVKEEAKPRIYEFVRDEKGRIIQILEYTK